MKHYTLVEIYTVPAILHGGLTETQLQWATKYAQEQVAEHSAGNMFLVPLEEEEWGLFSYTQPQHTNSLQNMRDAKEYRALLEKAFAAKGNLPETMELVPALVAGFVLTKLLPEQE